MKLTGKIGKLTAVLATILVLCVSTAVSADNEEVKVYIDGVQLTFDVNPIVENDRTLVPLRAIFEALGAEVEWDDDTQTATAVRGSDVVTVTIDSNTLYKNGIPVELDVPARMLNDRTLVPVRAISESFDAYVEWIDDTSSVIITTTLVPAATATPTATPTANPSEKAYLTDEDMETYKLYASMIRYYYEQSTLPSYVFVNADNMYEFVADKDVCTTTVKELWDYLAAYYVLEVQANSETRYTMSVDDEYALDYFSDVLSEAEIDSDSYIESVECITGENGTRLAIVTFKSAESLVECKYIGMVASENGAPRYFTAENDMMDTENWYFCEVMEEGRTTRGLFEKTGNAAKDLKTFEELIFDTYESDEPGLVSSFTNI